MGLLDLVDGLSGGDYAEETNGKHFVVAKNLLKSHNQNYNLIGFAKLGTAAPASPLANDAVISIESGTVFGVANVRKGQVLYYANGVWSSQDIVIKDSSNQIREITDLTEEIDFSSSGIMPSANVLFQESSLTFSFSPSGSDVVGSVVSYYVQADGVNNISFGSNFLVPFVAVNGGTYDTGRLYHFMFMWDGSTVLTSVRKMDKILTPPPVAGTPGPIAWTNLVDATLNGNTLSGSSQNGNATGGTLAIATGNYIDQEFVDEAAVISLTDETVNGGWGGTFNKLEHGIYIVTGNVTTIFNGTQRAETGISGASVTNLRLKVSGGNILYQASTNGSTYTTLRSEPISISTLNIFAHLAISGRRIINATKLEVV